MWLTLVSVLGTAACFGQLEVAFRSFESSFGKEYSSPLERAYRESVFAANKRAIDALNAAFGVSHGRNFTAEANKFADLTTEEFSEYFTMPGEFLKDDKRGEHEIAAPTRLLQAGQIPQKADWSRYVSPVKDQVQCNACYAFAALALAEASFAQSTGTFVNLSEQEIVDCSRANLDCVGGTPTAALDYVVNNQIAQTADYPYEAKKNDRCRVFSRGRRLQSQTFPSFSFPQFNFSSFPAMQTPSFPIFNPLPSYPSYSSPPTNSNPSPPTNSNPSPPTYPPQTSPNSFTPNARWGRLRGYRRIGKTMLSVLSELARGPILLSMHASREFSFYKSGVFDGAGCDSATIANHSALAVAYDLTAEVPYILFKNSWGSDWGDKGYFKMAIGALNPNSQGFCLVAATDFQLSAVL